LRRDGLRAFTIAFAAVLVFAPILSNDWVSWDDPEAIVENDALRDPGVVPWAFSTSHMSHFQPLSWLLWASAGRLFGFTPEVFHGLSLLFHVINAVLLYFLMGQLGLGRNASAIATLLYAVHPLRVEPVAWASAFPYLLSTSLVLAATLFYLRRSVAASALLYAGSILARPAAFAFPLVLLTVDLFRKRQPISRLLVEKAPFFALAVAGLVLEGRTRRFLDLEAYGLGARFTLAADSLLSHLGRLVWPIGLTPIDPLPLNPALDVPVLALGALVLAGSAALAFGLRSRFAAAPALWISWLLLLIPTLGLAPSGLQATADRYSYIPGLVVAIALGAALTRLPAAVSWGSLIAVVLLGGAAYRQGFWWKDSVTLWGRAVELDPKNDLALYFHASALAKAGRFDEATSRYRELLEILPDHGPARKDLARIEAHEADALAASGDLSAAIELYRKVLERDPDLTNARERLGMALFQLGRFQEALPELEAAFHQAGPSVPEVANAYALLLSNAGRVGEALAALEKAVSRFPEDVGVLHNLARLLATGAFPGRGNEAVALAERVVAETGGNDPRTLDTLGFALASRGSREESLRAFERASRLARSKGDESLAQAIEAHARAVAR
jgi:tetratricopeptide (TPR) repeat protein